MAAISLIVGLGNPGEGYARHRHNAGAQFVERVAEDYAVSFSAQAKLFGATAEIVIDGGRVKLFHPATYMNESGRAVQACLHYYRLEPEAMLVVHDELDLEPGTARLKFDGGHGGQNGLRDIIEKVGTPAFHRLRIGIGHPGHRDAVTPWVLGQAGREDREAIETAMDRSLGQLSAIVCGQFDAAMRELHST